MAQILEKNIPDTTKIPKFILQNLSTLQEKFPEKSEVISAYHEYISHQKFESDAQIINNFIGFLDMHFIDQITKQYQFSQVQSKEFWHSIYGRDRPALNASRDFLLQSKSYVKEEWKNTASLVDVSVFSYIENIPDRYHLHRVPAEFDFPVLSWDDKLNVIVCEQSLTFEQYGKIAENIPSNLQNFFLLWKIDLWEGIFMEFKISNYKKWWGNIYHELFDVVTKHPIKPISQADIQTILKKRLEYGYDIYGEYHPEKEIGTFQSFTKQQVQEILFSWNNKKSNKTLKLKTHINPEKKLAYEQKHTFHYQRFFQEENAWTPEIFLTSNGVSANDVVITYFSDQVPNFELWYEYDFYYENIPWFLRRRFQLNADTQVFLASPSILTPFPGKNKKDFQNKLKKDLKIFLKNVQNNPDKKYYLLFDVTTKLDLELKNWIGNDTFPNLVIAKSYSLTKHQRWETQYFFWWVALYNADDNAKTAIEKNISQDDYRLTPEQAVMYPRVTKTQIERNMENINANRKSFKAGFRRYLYSKNFHKFMPEIIDSDYFSILLLPLPEIAYCIKNYKFPTHKLKDFALCDRELLTVGNIDEKHPFWKDKFVLSTFLDYERISHPNMTFKDTFGLKTNNLGSYISNIWLLYFWKFDENLKSIATPRISFWTQKNTKHSYEMWGKFAWMYFMRVLKISELAQQKMLKEQEK